MNNITIHKIIAVLNDFEKADSVLKKALYFASRNDVLLEVLYVHEVDLFDVPDYFSTDEHVLDKDKVKKEIKERLVKLGSKKDHAIFVFNDDTADRIATQIKDESDVLIVTAYHDDITEKVIKKNQVLVLVLKNEMTVYTKIALPVDLVANTHPCIDLAKTLFPKEDKRLVYDYRYIVDTTMMDVDYLGVPTSAPVVDMQINEEIKKNQKEMFESLKKETGLQGDFIEETLSIEEDLSSYIETHGFDLAVLCSHKQDFLFSDTITYALLEMLKTDILVYNKG